MSICQERDGGATGAVTRELYDFGHQEGSTNRFYIKDHLGSVRGMVDDTGAITSAFDYDPYGRMTTLSGTETPSYGYAQLWHHGQTGLDLAVWRAYDPEIGRWLNRDPIGMAGGINVYEYVGSQPMLYSDPSGLVAPALAAGYALFESGSTAYDYYDAGSTAVDPCASGFEKLMAGGQILLGGVLPGSGKMWKEVGEYLLKEAPKWVQPGIRVLKGDYLTSGGRVEPWKAHYDEYGRRIARTDYSAGNKAHGIPEVHHHKYETNGQYPDGRELPNHYPGDYTHE